MANNHKEWLLIKSFSNNEPLYLYQHLFDFGVNRSGLGVDTFPQR